MRVEVTGRIVFLVRQFRDVKQALSAGMIGSGLILTVAIPWAVP